MKIFTALLLIAFTTAGIGAEETSKKSEFAWRKLGTAMTEAQKTKKMIMVDIYTDWWGWCKKLDRDVLSKEDVQAYLAENFIPVKLNAENKKDRVKILEHDLSYAEAVQAYGVKGFPATLFLEPDGQLIYMLSGYHPKDKYLDILKFMAERKFEEEPKEDKGE